MDLVFCPTSYFFPSSFRCQHVIQLLFPHCCFFSGFCHVGEIGFLLERLIKARASFLSEKLVYKKRGFSRQHKSKKPQSDSTKLYKSSGKWQWVPCSSIVVMGTSKTCGHFAQDLSNTVAFRGL